MKISNRIFFLISLLSLFFFIQSCCKDHIGYLGINSFEVYEYNNSGVFSNEKLDTINRPFQLRVKLDLEKSKCKNGSADLKGLIDGSISTLFCNQTFTYNGDIVPPQTNLLDLPDVLPLGVFELFTVNFTSEFLNLAIFQEGNYSFTLILNTTNGQSFASELEIPIKF